MRALLLAAAVLAGGVAAAAAADDVDLPRPPPLVLDSDGGSQVAVQHSYCFSGPGFRIGVDYGRRWPSSLTVARPGERLTFSMPGARLFPNEDFVSVSRLGCDGLVESFAIRDGVTEWLPRLQPGAYGVRMSAHFEASDGRAGQTGGVFGLLVDRERMPTVLGTPELGQAFRFGSVGGGNSRQRDLAREIWRGMRFGQRSQTLLHEPSEVTSWRGANAVCLVSSATTQAESLRARWESLLVAGAFRDRSRSIGLPRATLATSAVLTPHGFDGFASILLSERPRRTILRATRLQISRALQAGADAAGLRLGQVSFVQPGRLGVSATLFVQDPRTLAGRAETVLLPIFDRLRGRRGRLVEGVHFELRDASGTLLAVCARSFRLGAGVGWTGRELTGDSHDRGWFSRRLGC